ncbi:hypothetical protein LCGC14_0792280 [marine sediment metagenome]|uniref:Uncharacterized protein n=1 Tax=marine sediment metagenome TaxID=412755 RepID=A0A0F9SZB1_9ZZZZ
MLSDLDIVKLVEQMAVVIDAVDLVEEELFKRADDASLEKIAANPGDEQEKFGLQMSMGILALKKLIAEGRVEGYLPPSHT